jgi:hypothetical protein
MAVGAGVADAAVGSRTGETLAILGVPEMSRILARSAMAETWDRLEDEHKAMPSVSVIKMLSPHAVVMVLNLRGEQSNILSLPL